MSRATAPERARPAPPRAVALAAGPGAARALRGAPRHGTVKLAFRHGAYLRLGDEWLLACGPESPFGPLSLTVRDMAFERLRPGTAVRREPAGLRIGTQYLSVERVRERGTVCNGIRASSATIEQAVAAACEAVRTPPPSLGPGLAALERRRPRAAIHLLAGLGEGLTPAGDDVLAGYAAWRHAERSPVELSIVDDARQRCSPLGLAYLRCAERGELPDLAARAFDALRAGQPGAAARTARALAGWGASSGCAYLWGFAAGARATVHASAGAPSSAARNRSFSARVP